MWQLKKALYGTRRAALLCQGYGMQAMVQIGFTVVLLSLSWYHKVRYVQWPGSVFTSLPFLRSIEPESSVDDNSGGEGSHVGWVWVDLPVYRSCLRSSCVCLVWCVCGPCTPLVERKCSALRETSE